MIQATTFRRRARGLCGALVAGACLAVTACVPPLAVRPQTLAGRFAGVTAAGEAVVLSFSAAQESFRGEGTLAGEPLVVAGAAGWRGVGSLQRGAVAEVVSLALSADGETLAVERLGQPVLVLQREAGPTTTLAAGPFSGRFRAVKGRAPLAEVTLVDGGGLLSGLAILTGDPVGITGRVTAPRRAEGFVTFLDGSQTAFRAELSADGRSLIVEGFGEPITLQRRGAP